MELGDMLMILSIVVAMVAMAEANNKKIWIFKFCWLDIVLSTIVLLIIFLLIKYDDFIIRLPGLYRFFYCKNGIHSKTWAFAISLILLLVFIVRIERQKNLIVWGKNSQYNLIQYYNRLIYSDINMLVDFLYQYHIRNNEKTKNYLFPLIINNGFIIKTACVDQTLFPKLLIATKEFELQRDSYDAISNYLKCVVRNSDSQFLYELSQLYCALFVISEDKRISEFIKREGVFDALFKDKTYTFPTFMLSIIRIMAVDQLLHSKLFDEEPSLFFGLDQLYYRTYLQLYYVLLFYYISTANNSLPIVRSCYLLENKFYHFLPKTGDSENRINNKKRIIEEIDNYYEILIYYCEQHNYSQFFPSLLLIRLTMFHKDLIDNNDEDVCKLISIYLTRKTEWKNIDELFKTNLQKIIEGKPSSHKRFLLEIEKTKQDCSFPKRIEFFTTILRGDNQL